MRENLMKLKHSVVALDADGNTIGRIPVGRSGKAIVWETEDHSMAVHIAGYCSYLVHVCERYISIEGRQHKPAGFEVISEEVKEINEEG